MNNTYSSTRVFREACRSGNTSHLRRLINEKQFNINKPIIGILNSDRLPLISAIEEYSLPVVKLLFDQGVDPHTRKSDPLGAAIRQRKVSKKTMDIVLYLLGKGIKVSFNAMIRAIRLADGYVSKGLQVFKLVLVRASEQLDSPDVDAMSRILGRYARLSLAIIEGDKTRIAQLLRKDDQDANSEEVIEDHYKIASYRAGRLKMTKGDLVKVYDNPLHMACRFHQLEAVKLLVQEYGLELDEPCDYGPYEEQDFYGGPPLAKAKDPEFYRSVLALYPEVNINHVSNRGLNYFLWKRNINCAVYVALIEHGAQIKFYVDEDEDEEEDEDEAVVVDVDELNDHIHCVHVRNDNEDYEDDYYDPDQDDCEGVVYLRKLLMIDEDYVNQVLHLWPHFFGDVIEDPDTDKYEAEIAEMKSINISQGTTLAKPKNLFAAIFFDANEAARYSINEVILKIYQDNGQDFRQIFPHYGFILNYQLRRGQVRYERQNAAFKFLCDAIGTDMPGEFAEFIFGYFTNQTLVYYYTSEVES